MTLTILLNKLSYHERILHSNRYFYSMYCYIAWYMVLLSNKYPIFWLVKIFTKQLHLYISIYSLMDDIWVRVHLSVKIIVIIPTYRYFLKYTSYSCYYIVNVLVSKIHYVYTVELRNLIIIHIFNLFTLGITYHFSKILNIRCLMHKIDQ